MSKQLSIFIISQQFSVCIFNYANAKSPNHSIYAYIIANELLLLKYF